VSPAAASDRFLRPVGNNEPGESPGAPCARRAGGLSQNDRMERFEQVDRRGRRSMREAHQLYLSNNHRPGIGDGTPAALKARARCRHPWPWVIPPLVRSRRVGDEIRFAAKG
jgi:hypothetical protein